MAKDWVRWHDDYATPGSSLARRLEVVQEQVRRVFDRPPAPRRLLSICAGDGRDVLPVLASHPGVRALLVELDPELADQARRTATELGLPNVEVRTADAGATATYAGVEPVDLLLACGVFGNVPAGDMRRTIAALPALMRPGATVIWTRGRGDGGPDPSLEVRERFRAGGFEEVAFVAPDDARFRVGVARWPGGGTTGLPAVPRLFSFV